MLKSRTRKIPSSILGGGIFYKMIEQYKTSLKKEGISIYPATLAIKTGNENGCVHCGLCMYGCPYSAIYSSQMTLSELQHFKKSSACYYGSRRFTKCCYSYARRSILAYKGTPRDVVSFVGHSKYFF